MVDHQQGQHGAEQGTAPVGPVDGDVHPAPVLGRDQLVDGRVDGGVLAADAHAGDEARDPQPVDPELGVAEGQRGQEPSEEVHAQGDHEEVAAAPLVRQPAEEQRPEHLAQQVDRAHGEGHPDGRRLRDCLLLMSAGDVAGDGDLEPVENPGHPESHHQPGVEARPAQPVEPGRNEAVDQVVAAVPAALGLGPFDDPARVFCPGFKRRHANPLLRSASAIPVAAAFQSRAAKSITAES